MSNRRRSAEEAIQLAIRLGLLAILAYWCFVIVRPFIPILAWSVVLAVALYPSSHWLSDHLGERPKLAAAIITAILAVIMIGPATWLVVGFIDGLRTISDQLAADRLTLPAPPGFIREWPLIGARLFDLWTQASTNAEAVLAQYAPQLKPLVRPLLALAGSAGLGTLEFLISVVLAGFLLPAGPRLAAASRNLMAHVLPERSEDLVALAGATIRTISQGVIGVALLQSVLFGVGLRFAGIESAAALAFAVLVLGILQIGSAIVLIPCLIWIWMTHDLVAALLFTVYLTLVGLSDNVLKPLLMGRGLTTPMPVIFIGLLGGTLAHGIVGLFIGPIILAVAWELTRAWLRDERARAIEGPDRVPATAERLAAEAETPRI